MVWLASRFSSGVKEKSSFETATVKSSSKELVVNGDAELRSVGIVSGYGYNYIPRKGSKVIIAKCGEKTVCIGTQNNATNISEGEIIILNDSGAKIILNSSGEIVLNGVKISKDGVISAKEFVLEE